MNYQLANGKTIRLSDEQFFKMSDQDLKDLEGSNYGYIVNDPFYDSILDDEPVYDFFEENNLDGKSVIDEDFLDIEE